MSGVLMFDIWSVGDENGYINNCFFLMLDDGVERRCFYIRRKSTEVEL